MQSLEVICFCRCTGLQPPATPLFGFPRDSDVLKVYADAVEKAKADCEKLMIKAKQGCSQIEEAKVIQSWFNLLNFYFLCLH
jgi:hypothetical protein